MNSQLGVDHVFPYIFLGTFSVSLVLLFNKFIFSQYLQVTSSTIPPFFPYTTSKSKEENIQRNIQSGTYQQKCGLRCCKSAKYISYFHPGLWMFLILKHQNLTKVLLLTYVFPSICGQNDVYIFNLVSIFSLTIVQKNLRNMLFLSKMMVLGIAKCTQTRSMKMFVSSCPLMVFL